MAKQLETIPIYIGYDPREAIAYNVLAHSIIDRASVPVSIAPLKRDALRAVFKRPWHPLQSTAFAFTRFLVPYLCGFKGWALFMDCDMLVMEDIAALWKLRNARYAVQVVKHHHVPKETTKFLGEPQRAYARKNWSSVMLFNCPQCTALTPQYVNRASGLELHQFKWLAKGQQIGRLPAKWNHLVGVDRPRTHAANAHFTLGGPYFEESANCEFAPHWQVAKMRMLHAEQKRG